MGKPCFRSLSSLKKIWVDKNIRVLPTFKRSSNTGRANELFNGNSRKEGWNPRFHPSLSDSTHSSVATKKCPLFINYFEGFGNEELQIEHHQHCCSRNLTFNSCDPFYRRVTSRKDTFLASPVSACHRPTSTTTAPTAEWWCPNSEALRPRPINGRWKSSRRLTGPITKWWGWAHAKSFWMPATSIASPSSILRAGDQSPPITVTFKSRPCKRSKGIMHKKVPASMFPGFCEGKLQTRNLFRCARWAGVWSRQHQSTLPPVVLIATGMSSGGALLYRFACM